MREAEQAVLTCIPMENTVPENYQTKWMLGSPAHITVLWTPSRIGCLLGGYAYSMNRHAICQIESSHSYKGTLSYLLYISRNATSTHKT
eukprot:5864185-Ditylum_brightwellii.AAC.1